MFGRFGLTLSSERLQRLEEDRVVLAEVAPRLRHYTLADGRGALAEGIMEVDVGAGCWEAVAICMEFGPAYPDEPPRVFDAAPRWKPELDRHLMRNHQFCLWLAQVDTPQVVTSEQFREFLLRLYPFLQDQFVFDDIGRWPGPEWKHGPRAAYAQHLVEALGTRTAIALDALWPAVLGSHPHGGRACPCGSGQQYDRCHKRTIGDLQWIQQLGERDELPDAVRDHLRDVA